MSTQKQRAAAIKATPYDALDWIDRVACKETNSIFRRKDPLDQQNWAHGALQESMVLAYARGKRDGLKDRPVRKVK